MSGKRSILRFIFNKIQNDYYFRDTNPRLEQFFKTSIFKKGTRVKNFLKLRFMLYNWYRSLKLGIVAIFKM